CLTALAKCWFPFPPLPPLATTALSPSSFKSAITSPVASSLIIVPGGTLRIKSSPFLPAFLFLLPSSPCSATYFLWYLKSINVLRPKSTSNITLAPFPPSPPSGPPAGTYFSLLNDTAPFPPFPDLTKILALSINKLITYLVKLFIYFFQNRYITFCKYLFTRKRSVLTLLLFSITQLLILGIH